MRSPPGIIQNTPGSPWEGLSTHFEGFILLAALAVTKFPKCSGQNEGINHCSVQCGSTKYIVF